LYYNFYYICEKVMQSRIQKLIGAENLTPTRFADIIGVQRSAISHIITGRNNPSFDLIQKILSKFPRVSSEWLIMGRGEMYKTTVQQRLFDFDQGLPAGQTQKPIESQDTKPFKDEHVSIKPPENQKNEPGIERIIIFFSDKSFREYYPRR